MSCSVAYCFCVRPDSPRYDSCCLSWSPSGGACGTACMECGAKFDMRLELFSVLLKTLKSVSCIFWPWPRTAKWLLASWLSGASRLLSYGDIVSAYCCYSLRVAVAPEAF